MLFSYHTGLQALVMPHPTIPGQQVAVPTKTLRDLGWKCDDDDLRKTLPRADPSIIHAAPPELATKLRRRF
jgi:hypothetical protein